MWHIIELFVHRVIVQKEDDDWENDRASMGMLCLRVMCA
jgi:hypothetical protein